MERNIMPDGLCHTCFSSGNKLFVDSNGTPECEECSKKTKIKE